MTLPTISLQLAPRLSARAMLDRDSAGIRRKLFTNAQDPRLPLLCDISTGLI